MYDHARGSHFCYKHPTKKGTVIISNHKGDIPKGTLHSIMKQAGLK
ncbi:MAG: type II toxin-antitoxin system HicA family toxin [Ruminococcus sp.]|nr:type II toxin-antitoxin system HicA family toxin [Ruminococcus sp.]